MKKFYVCTNFRINLSISETLTYTKKLISYVNNKHPDNQKVKIFFVPDFLSLYPVSKLTNNSIIDIGAQNCFWDEKGSFTGEVSVSSLKEIDCKYVMVGHPERMFYFKEDLGMVNKKIITLIRNRITPIAFIIDSNEDHDLKKTCTNLKEQILNLFKDIDLKDLHKIILFYTPASAVRTLKIPSISYINSIISEMRNTLNETFGNNFGNKQIFFYGGNLNLNNAQKLIETNCINGIGMGKDALNFDNFTNLIDIAISIYK